jgi:hypothetical protein
LLNAVLIRSSTRPLYGYNTPDECIVLPNQQNNPPVYGLVFLSPSELIGLSPRLKLAIVSVSMSEMVIVVVGVNRTISFFPSSACTKTCS